MGFVRTFLCAAPSFVRVQVPLFAWACAPGLAACASPLAASHDIDRPGDAAQASTIALPSNRPGSSPQRPLIAKLQFRDVELAILSSADGPRFSVTTAEGAVLAADVGEAELRALYPALHQFYRSALARSAGPYLDARLDARHGDDEGAAR